MPITIRPTAPSKRIEQTCLSPLLTGADKVQVLLLLFEPRGERAFLWDALDGEGVLGARDTADGAPTRMRSAPSSLHAMKKGPVVALIILCLWLAAPMSAPPLARAASPQERPRPVLFFDVLDLPARIDEPKLQRKANQYLLTCALANRSGEQLVGLRLTLMVVDSSGKVRTRISWNEAATVPAYSIKTFEFNPTIKGEISNGAPLFLGVDEVIGRETIWRTVDSDKLLRAYARGQHDLIPKVQTLINKVDAPRNGVPIMQIKLKPPPEEYR